VSSEMRMCWINKHTNTPIRIGLNRSKSYPSFSLSTSCNVQELKPNQSRLLPTLFSDWSKFKSCPIHWLNIYALEVSSRVPCCSSVFSLFLLMVSEVVGIVVSATRTRKHVESLCFPSVWPWTEIILLSILKLKNRRLKKVRKEKTCIVRLLNSIIQLCSLDMLYIQYYMSGWDKYSRGCVIILPNFF
jgi:hypothetical protein